MQNNSQLKLLSSVLVLPVTLVAGTIFWLHPVNQAQATGLQTDTVNAVLISTKPASTNSMPSNQLQSLMQEHAVLATEAVFAHMDNRPDATAAMTALDQNTQAIATMVGNAYGTNAKNQFLSLWNQHIQLYMQYADAAKSGDTNQKQQTLNQLNQCAMDMGNFFASKSSNVSTSSLTSIFQTHMQGTTSVIDSHAAGDFESQYHKLDIGFNQAGYIGDVLAQVLSYKK